MHTVRD